MKVDKSFILGLFLCVIGLLPWNPGRFAMQVSVALVVAGILIGIHLLDHFDWSVSLLFVYVWLEGVVYFRWPRYFFGIFTPLTQEMFLGIVQGAVLWLLVATFVGYILVRKDRFSNHKLPTFEKALHYVFWAEVTSLVVRRILDARFLGHWVDHFVNPLVQGRFLGMCDNESVDACFLLCLYPIVVLKNRGASWLVHFLVLFLVVASGASTAMGAYAVLLGIIFFFKIENRFIAVACSVVSAGVIAGLGYLTIGWQQFISSSGRWHIWQITNEYWWKAAPHWTGVGVGSFLLYGPGIQLQGHAPGTINTIFIWEHSEPQQILFELGYIGLSLTLLMCGRMLWRSYKGESYSGNPWMLCACMMFFVTDMTQMHLRFSMLTVVGIYLVSYILGKEDGQFLNHC